MSSVNREDRGQRQTKPDEANFITQQVGRCTRFAKRKGWFVSDDYIFTDSGQSGLKMNSGLKNLMRIAAVNPKPFDVFLCTSIDRIARDTDLAIRINEALKEFGVEIRVAELVDNEP
jgi:DNA invertase Pin-like site-specific DNA recombinase